MKNWTFEDTDAQAAAELDGFLPDNIYDAHAHLYRTADMDLPADSLFRQGPAEVGVAAWREILGRQVKAARLQGALFIPMPFVTPAGIPETNAYVLRQAASMPASRALAVIAPETSPDLVNEWCKHPQFVGFKPYHLYSSHKPTFDSPLTGFLPEWAWEAADRHGLVITLHMVKTDALADPDNQREIREHCRRYPRAKLVLAHGARGFHAPNTVKGIAALRGLENVWFDTSAICEPTALLAILREFGPRRLLWGSDFPVSEIRGKCVTLGDGFAWLQPDTIAWEKLLPGCHPILVGLEALRAVREAAQEFGLSAADVQDIFADNAMRLLGIRSGGGTVTQDLYRHAKQRMPGGTQLLSKRPEMMAPEQWPAYFREARGCEVWDLDGRHYYDMSINAVGACLLGFRDPDVTRAVQRRVELGSLCSLNPPEEVELADLLCEIHPWAEQVRFTRTGGESCAVAVRIARATTGRSVVAICGYHGWQDWYLAANLGENDALRGHLLPGLNPTGVPGELRGTAFTFGYEDRKAFQAILDAHGSRLAAVIMEPCRYHDPAPGYLEFVRDEAHQHGALLIFDEITIGWRLHHGGSHLRLGVHPDLAVFGKTLGNGHAMGAVLGTASAMEGAQSSFISSSYWTESIGPVAALVAVRKMKAVDVVTHVARVGMRAHEFWRQAGERYGLPVVTGQNYPCLAGFKIDHPAWDELRTLYSQCMLARGFLAGATLNGTHGHTDAIMDRYGEAISEVFRELAAALATNSVRARLQGPVAHSGFRRLL